MPKTRRFSISSILIVLRKLREGEDVETIAAQHDVTADKLEPLASFIAASIPARSARWFFLKGSFWGGIATSAVLAVFLVPIGQTAIYPLLPSPQVQVNLSEVRGTAAAAGCMFYLLRMHGPADDDISAVNLLLTVHGKLASHKFSSGQPVFTKPGESSSVVLFDYARDKHGKCMVAQAFGQLDPEFREVDGYDYVRLAGINPQRAFALDGAFVVDREPDIQEAEPSIIGSTFVYQKYRYNVPKPLVLSATNDPIYGHVAGKHEPNHYTFKFSEKPTPRPEAAAGAGP